MRPVRQRSHVDAIKSQFLVTRIDFYSPVENKVRLAFTIGSKVVARDQTMVILLPDEAAMIEFDKALWSVAATSFLPHCRADNRLASQTPILLTCDDPPAEADQILLNLAESPPGFFGRFERLVEFVGTAPEDIARSRERFRFYRDRGYEIQTHNLAGLAQRGPL